MSRGYRFTICRFSAFFDPIIQKLHLFPGMEPMLPVGHDGQIRMVPLGKCRYRFNGCQVVVLTVENVNGTGYLDALRDVFMK